MAWLLVIPIVGAGAVYAGNAISEFWDETTKPYYDWRARENKDTEERIMEDIRRNDIERKKERYRKNDMIRQKYNIGVQKEEPPTFPIMLVSLVCDTNDNKPMKKIDNKITTFINNSDDVCYLIFVNHHYATNKNEAIIWAEKKMKFELFDGQVFNKLSTRKECIGVDNRYDLIGDEFNEYFIVLNVGDKYFVLDNKNDIVDGIIKCKNVMYGPEKNEKINNYGVDVGCRKLFY